MAGGLASAGHGIAIGAFDHQRIAVTDRVVDAAIALIVDILRCREPDVVAVCHGTRKRCVVG